MEYLELLNLSSDSTTEWSTELEKKLEEILKGRKFEELLSDRENEKDIIDYLEFTWLYNLNLKVRIFDIWDERHGGKHPNIWSKQHIRIYNHKKVLNKIESEIFLRLRDKNKLRNDYDGVLKELSKK